MTMESPLPPSPTVLCADGVSRPQCQALARRANVDAIFGSALSQGLDEARGGGDLVLLISGLDENRLTQALRPPFRACYEIKGTETSLPDVLFTTVALGGIFISLTTESAFKTNFCAHLIKGLDEFFEIPKGRLNTIELVVHEALANAILRGNLENEGFSRSDAESFECHALALDKRIQNTAYNLRRVDVAASREENRLKIAISNEGPGFDPALISHGDTAATRGVPLIRRLTSSMEFSDRGRTLTMMLDL